MAPSQRPLRQTASTPVSQLSSRLITSPVTAAPLWRLRGVPTQARLSPPWRSWPEKADSPQPQPSGESVAAIVALDPAALDPAQARLIPLASFRDWDAKLF